MAVVALLGLGVAALWLTTSDALRESVRQSAFSDFPMPTFRLPVLNGGLLRGDTTFLSSADLKGHVVLLDYWAVSCKACIAEQPLLMELQNDYGGAGLRVVGVLDNDRAEGALAWLRAQHREQFLTVVGDGKVARAVHVGSLPATLIVDRDGQVVGRFDGYSKGRDPYLRGLVRELVVKRSKGSPRRLRGHG